MRVLTSKDGDLLSQFDNINGGGRDKDFDSTFSRTMLINNHEADVDRGKIRGQLPLELIFGFCKTFEEIPKSLGFHISFKTADLQNIIFTSIPDAT